MLVVVCRLPDHTSASASVGAVSGGRVDIRLGMDNEENLYILSKVDGTIREVVGATVSQEK